MHISEECYNDIINLTEAIINEVSINKLKQAAKNSISTRKDKEEKAFSNLGEVTYPFRGAIYDPENKRANAWDEAAYRLDRAEQLVKSLPNSNRSATKLKAIAKNVVSNRNKENEMAFDSLKNKAKEFFDKASTERTNKDYDGLKRAHKNYWSKQNKEDKAHMIIGKKFRRPEEDSSGKYELKDQGFIDRREQ